MKLKIGVEVELVVSNQREPVVCDFLKYTKSKPLIDNGNLYMKDASLLEIALRPCSSPEQYEEAVEEGLYKANQLLPPNHSLSAQACTQYTQEQLDKDPYSSVLGCGQSLNFYEHRKMPAQYTDTSRYGGVHVNVSIGSKMPLSFVYGMDSIAGLLSASEWETDAPEKHRKRRTWYGRAGEYRRKPFGIEYRTLPSIAFFKMDGNKLFSMVERALSWGQEFDTEQLDKVQSIINNSDGEGALSMRNLLCID